MIRITITTDNATDFRDVDNYLATHDEISRAMYDALADMGLLSSLPTIVDDLMYYGEASSYGCHITADEI